MDVHELTARWQKVTEHLKSGWEKLIAKLYSTSPETKSLEIDSAPTAPVVDARSITGSV